MTLADLYNSIDWSSAEEALTKWQIEHKQETRGNPEFAKDFREGLVAYSLPPEIVGDLPDWTDDRQRTARVALKYAGVWDQICDRLVEYGLLGTIDRKAKEQLTMNFN
jgi:hypothetical protein